MSFRASYLSAFESVYTRTIRRGTFPFHAFIQFYLLAARASVLYVTMEAWRRGTFLSFLAPERDTAVFSSLIEFSPREDREGCREEKAHFVRASALPLLDKRQWVWTSQTTRVVSHRYIMIFMIQQIHVVMWWTYGWYSKYFNQSTFSANINLSPLQQLFCTTC